MRFSLTLALLAAAGCAGVREAPSPFDRGGAASQTIRISVVNNNFNEATLHALYQAQRRLGVVPGNGRSSFDLNWPSVTDLRIRIDVLAGDDFTTNRITVGPGESVYLTIENPLYRSWLRR